MKEKKQMQKMKKIKRKNKEILLEFVGGRGGPTRGKRSSEERFPLVGVRQGENALPKSVFLLTEPTEDPLPLPSSGGGGRTFETF